MYTFLESRLNFICPAGKLPGRPAYPTQELTAPGERTGVLSGPEAISWYGLELWQYNWSTNGIPLSGAKFCAMTADSADRCVEGNDIVAWVNAQKIC